MKAELQAIKDAWEATPRDDDGARTLADQYVSSNPDEFNGFQGMTIEQLVEAIDTFRSANMEEDQWRIETWLLHRYTPQNIGGIYQPQLRNVEV